MSGLLLHPAVATVLISLAVTLLFQFRPFSTRVLSLDLLGIVPRWKFFIPQSGRFEVAIEFRGGCDDSNLGPWIPVSIFPPRRAWTFLWFPEQHRAAILWLSAHRVAVRINQSYAPNTLAYQTLVRHLRQVAKKRDFTIFQFALLHPDNRTDDRTIFTSHVHAR